jgi:hypothetical protein
MRQVILGMFVGRKESAPEDFYGVLWGWYLLAANRPKRRSNMGEILQAMAVKLLVALIESDGFMVLAHHAFDSVVSFLMK